LKENRVVIVLNLINHFHKVRVIPVNFNSGFGVNTVRTVAPSWLSLSTSVPYKYCSTVTYMDIVNNWQCQVFKKQV
jgi:hypothetical protein